MTRNEARQAKLLALAKEHIFETLGIEARDIEPVPMSGGPMKPIFVTELSPKMMGAAGVMFRSMEVTVLAGAPENRDDLYLTYEFKYTHSQGGSNGYSVRFKNEDLSWKEGH